MEYRRAYRHRPDLLQRCCMTFPRILVSEIRIFVWANNISISYFMEHVIERYGFNFNEVPSQVRTPKNYKALLTPYLPVDLVKRIEALYGPRSVPRVALNAYILYRAEHLDELESAQAMHTLDNL